MVRDRMLRKRVLNAFDRARVTGRMVVARAAGRKAGEAAAAVRSRPENRERARKRAVLREKERMVGLSFLEGLEGEDGVGTGSASEEVFLEK